MIRRWFTYTGARRVLAVAVASVLAMTVAAALHAPGARAICPAGGSTPPRLVTAPALSGSASVGSTLTTSNGSWTACGPITYTYQWFRANPGHPIPGATAASYTLQPSDGGSLVFARVFATYKGSGDDTGATASADSNVAGVPSTDIPSVESAPGSVQTATEASVAVTATDSSSGIAQIELVQDSASGHVVLARQDSPCVINSGSSCPASATANFTYTADQDAAGILSVIAINRVGNTSAPDYSLCDPGDHCTPQPNTDAFAGNDTTAPNGTVTYAPDTSGDSTTQPKQQSGVADTSGGSADPSFAAAFEANAQSSSLRTCTGWFRPYDKGAQGFPVANIYFKRGKYGKLYWDFYLTKIAQTKAEREPVLVLMPNASVNGTAINPPYAPHLRAVTYDFHSSMQNYQTVLAPGVPLWGKIKTGDTVTFLWYVATAPDVPNDFSAYLACKVPQPGVG